MARKAVVKNDATNVNVNELIFHLKKQYQPHNEEPRVFVEDIHSQEDRPFNEIADYLKTFSKSIEESENMSLKNKTLMGDWISAGARVFRRDENMLGENLSSRFEDWMYKVNRTCTEVIEL